MSNPRYDSPLIDDARPDLAGGPPRGARRSFPWVNLTLFLLTLYTTLVAGAAHLEINAFWNPRNLVYGIPFSFTLMTILLTHEMGHYLASRYHRVEATLPYFIPAPPFFIVGTFGAFIRMTSPITNRRALLDIGAAGPIAGFIVAIPAIAIGLNLSTDYQNLSLGDLKLGAPLIFWIITFFVFGPLPEGFPTLYVSFSALHPILVAGWIGIFVTALNLLPIGQLDGGHITFAVFARYHRLFSLGMVPVLLALGYFGWPGWYLWAVIPLIFGIGHPPLVDAGLPLDRRRIVIGSISLIVLILSFTPVPISI